MSDTHHISQAGVITGPFTTAQIRSLWKSGGITADSMHRPAGSETWSPVADLIKNTSIFTATLGRRGHLTPWGWAGSIAGIIGTINTQSIFVLIPLTVWIVSYFKLRRGDVFRPFSAQAWIFFATFTAAGLCLMYGLHDYRATQRRNQERADLNAELLKIDRDYQERSREFSKQYQSGQ